MNTSVAFPGRQCTKVIVMGDLGTPDYANCRFLPWLVRLFFSGVIVFLGDLGAFAGVLSGTITDESSRISRVGVQWRGFTQANDRSKPVAQSDIEHRVLWTRGGTPVHALLPT